MKGLLSVSFGTSYADTRAKTIDAIDRELAAAFPERAFYSAWTSPRIRAKVLAERGEQHDSLDDAFARMTADGVDDLVVGTMCLMDGGEMRKIAEATHAWASQEGRTARLARPLLSSAEDRDRMARALAAEFAQVAEDEALLLMGHGSEHGVNQLYADLQDALHAQGLTNFFVATVEGTPVFDDVLPLIQTHGAARVWLAPLMIVAGDHARNDLAGEGEGSWASRLRMHGFAVQMVLKGLGEYGAVQKLAVDHALAAGAC